MQLCHWFLSPSPPHEVLLVGVFLAQYGPLGIIRIQLACFAEERNETDWKCIIKATGFLWESIPDLGLQASSLGVPPYQVASILPFLVPARCLTVLCLIKEPHALPRLIKTGSFYFRIRWAPAGQSLRSQERFPKKGGFVLYRSSV